jgi:glycosyltransferase involved in cell wall biosynthesis
MRICLVSQEYPPETAHGGIGSQNWNKARALAGRGHEVEVVSSAVEPRSGTCTKSADGVTVHRIQPPGFEFPVYESPTFWLGYSWAVLRELRRLSAARPFDVVDFAEYGGEGFAFQMDRTEWTWAPVVVQLHGPLAMFAERVGWPERGSDFHRVVTFMEDFSIRAADRVMACSANIADFTAEHHGIAREEIDVVHCGVDAHRFLPDRREGRGSGRPTVLFVGNVTPSKGVETLADAVLRVRPSHPDVLLRVLGKGDDDLMAEIRGRFAAAGALDNLDIGRFVADRALLPAEYAAADVFCSPAQHEVGVANVYIEAMASGLPVVAATTGAAPEAVAEGSTGFLVPPGDAQATAMALDRLLSDTELRARMGDAARARVDGYFAMERYVERVLATYERAIATSQAKLRAIRHRDEAPLETVAGSV